jgi:hypothetical protein
VLGRLKTRLITGVSVFWLRYARYRWSRLRRRIERHRHDVPLPAVSTIDDVRAALEQVRWVPDAAFHLYDAVSNPATTWAKKQDDCDGFAALAAELLTRIDVRHAPMLVTVVVLPLRRAHTVCAFRSLDSNEVRVFDNARLVEERFDSLDGVVGYVARRGERAIAWDIVRPGDLRPVAFGRFPESSPPSA